MEVNTVVVKKKNKQDQRRIEELKASYMTYLPSLPPHLTLWHTCDYASASLPSFPSLCCTVSDETWAGACSLQEDWLRVAFIVSFLGACSTEPLDPQQAPSLSSYPYSCPHSVSICVSCPSLLVPVSLSLGHKHHHGCFPPSLSPRASSGCVLVRMQGHAPSARA